MSWRIIIRIGMSNDTGSSFRNTNIEPLFLAMGLTNTATGTWEGIHLNQASAASNLGQVLTALGALPANGAAIDLKHLWIYIDND